VIPLFTLQLGGNGFVVVSLVLMEVFLGLAIVGLLGRQEIVHGSKRVGIGSHFLYFFQYKEDIC
jgi:hypothetical protein